MSDIRQILAGLRRRAAFPAWAIAAVIGVLAVSAVVWGQARAPRLREFTGAEAELPASVAHPFLWQRTAGGDPNGPVKMTFESGRSLNLESALVLIGADDSYRLSYQSPGQVPGALSPNGRWLLDQDLLDLSTGDRRGLDRPLRGHPVAVWSGDSRLAVGITARDEIVLVDVATAATRVLGRVGGGLDWRAAFSTDGARLALHAYLPGQGNELTILDTRTGAPARVVALTAGQRLAGPAAWVPHSDQLALFTTAANCTWADQCAASGWRVERLDTDSGSVSPDLTQGMPGLPNLVAWRAGDPVAQLRDPAGRCTYAALRVSGGEALPLGAPGPGCPEYARTLLEQSKIGAPAIRPSPWQAQWWAYAGPVLLAGAAALVAWRRSRRSRQSSLT